MRTLTRAERNRALLARQGLLERSDAPVPRMLERMGLLQAQYAPSMYVGLWTRTAGLTRAEVTGALEARSAVQGTLLRQTIHLVSREDYWDVALAIRDARRRWWLTTGRRTTTAAAMAGAARRLRRALGDGVLHRREIEQLIGRELVGGIGAWIDLVRVPPSGTWARRRADLYASAEAWLGPPPDGLTPAVALDRLLRRYLAAFGPAAQRDIETWMGLAPGGAGPALRRAETVTYRGEGGETLHDLPGAPLPPAATPAPVRLLPTFDAVLLVHARGTGILPEAHRPRVFHVKMPQSVGTVLVDGAVAAAWRPVDGGIAIEPFELLEAATLRAVDEEAGRLAAWSA